MDEFDVHAAFRDAIMPKSWYRRIENQIGSGDPDIHYIVDDKPGWAEGKFARVIPARLETAVFDGLNRGLTHDQENWLFDYDRHGGTCWIFARIGIKNPFYVLVPGSKAFTFNAMTMSQFDPYRMPLKGLRAALART